MKKLVPLIIIFLLIIPVSAEDLINASELLKAVPDDVTDVIGSDIDDTENTLGRLYTSLKQSAVSALKQTEKRALSVIAVAAICGMLSIFDVSDSMPDYIHLCACAAVTVICIGDMDSYISTAVNSLNELSDFSKAALPAMCTACAACGAVSSAAAKYAASALYMDIFITAAQNVIVPLIYAYIAVTIAQAAFDNASLVGICKLLKWGCTSLMTVFTLVFTAYMSISSAVGSGGDAVTAKIAKTAISAALPVVGGIISDAASSVVAGAELIKNTVGVFGLVAVLGICVAPFALFGINYLVYKATAVLVSAFSSARISSLINGISGAFGMLLSLIGCCGIFIFISIMSCIKAVSVVG